MRKIIVWVVMSLVAIALLGGCLPRYVPVADAEVNAALKEVLLQYEKRADLTRDLIMLVQSAANRNDTLVAAVVAAQADLGCIRIAPEALAEQVAFERFEIAQRQLGDAVSRLLVESGNDRVFHKDPRFRSLSRQLGGVDRQIAVTQKAYDEAADRYNASLNAFPHDIEARILALHERPGFSAAAETATWPPRTDFGTLRGSMRV
ncbi:LemA family protein [Paraburkholderia bryophila]|uniref:LemA protein n=1 Tax=Paraburkholderia bryophila TaxID=420952 RepID=A0A7Y9W5U3_9BURK|nr:LemA family protein [Paraburkholderia bryophila]NYH14153.1 LemA protein [Paraburkholderia bryophila]